MADGGIARHLLDIVADDADRTGGAHRYRFRMVAGHCLVDGIRELLFPSEHDVRLIHAGDECARRERGNFDGCRRRIDACLRVRTCARTRTFVTADARVIGAAYRSVRDEQDIADSAEHKPAACHIAASASVEHAGNRHEPSFDGRRPIARTVSSIDHLPPPSSGVSSMETCTAAHIRKARGGADRFSGRTGDDAGQAVNGQSTQTPSDRASERQRPSRP